MDGPIEIALRDFDILDKRTTYILNATEPTATGDPLKIYTYYQDPYYKEIALNCAWVDWISFQLSFIKLVKAVVLWNYGATMPAFVALLT